MYGDFFGIPDRVAHIHPMRRSRPPRQGALPPEGTTSYVDRGQLADDVLFTASGLSIAVVVPGIDLIAIVVEAPSYRSLPRPLRLARHCITGCRFMVLGTARRARPRAHTDPDTQLSPMPKPSSSVPSQSLSKPSQKGLVIGGNLVGLVVFFVVVDRADRKLGVDAHPSCSASADAQLLFTQLSCNLVVNDIVAVVVDAVTCLSDPRVTLVVVITVQGFISDLVAVLNPDSPAGRSHMGVADSSATTYPSWSSSQYQARQGYSQRSPFQLGLQPHEPAP